MQSFKKDAEKLNNKKLELEAKININEKEYKAKIDKLYEDYKEKISSITNFDGTINLKKQKEIDNKFNTQLSSINDKSNYVKATLELEKINSQILKNKEKQEEWNAKVEELNLKLAKAEGLDDAKEKIGDINNSIQKTIKKVGSLALAVFGVRSAYMAVRSAASTLAQYNEQIGNDLSYIKFALASALQPVVEKLISLVYKLLAYVNYLAQAWFGINLFAKATTDNFNKINQAAKKLKKTTTGWDELNILSDNSNEATYNTPSVDLSKSGVEDIQIPKWLEWLNDNWKTILIGVLGIVGAFILFSKIKIGKIGTSFTGFFDGLGKAASAIAILGGLALVIQTITELIEAFSESGMTLGEVAGLLGIVLGEVAGAFIILLGAMTLLQPSWQSIAAAAVIFAGLALVLESVSHLIDTFANSGLSLNEVIGLMSTILLTIIGLMGSIVLLGPAMTAGLGPFLAVVAGISAILLVMAATLPTILDATGNFIEKTAPSLCAILETIGKLIVAIINSLGNNLPPIIKSIGNLFNSIFNGVDKIVNSVGNTIIKILNAIGSLVNSVLGSLLGFINNLGPATENFVSHVISAVTKLINFMISGIEYLVNRLVVDGVNAIINGINKIGKYVGFTIPNVAEFKIARFKPTYMATGGIIDVPKRGMPLAGNVIGGEAGAEGVLPLTDEATMKRLGQEIAKWIVLNIQLNNYIDGRLLCKFIKKIMNGQEFATNGGN